MKLLSKSFLAGLLLTVTGVSWGACPEGYKNNYKGECIEASVSSVRTINYGNGVSYKGQTKDGKRHGQGTLTFKNGDYMVGEWKNGELHGQVISYKADGRIVLKGEFKEGELWSGVQYDLGGNVQATVSSPSTSITPTVAANVQKLLKTKSCPSCDLHGAHIRGNLNSANLSGANLTGATLSGNWTRVNLTGANLTGAKISIDLYGTNLTGTNLTGANLRGSRNIGDSWNLITVDRLMGRQIAILCNTTMPDRTINNSGCTVATAPSTPTTEEPIEDEACHAVHPVTGELLLGVWRQGKQHTGYDMFVCEISPRIYKGRIYTAWEGANCWTEGDKVRGTWWVMPGGSDAKGKSETQQAAYIFMCTPSVPGTPCIKVDEVSLQHTLGVWIQGPTDGKNCKISAESSTPTKPETTPTPQPEAPSLQLVGTGTAFVVSENYLLTASHVIEECVEVSIRHSHEETDVAIAAWDETNDLGLLKSPESFEYTAKFRGGKSIRKGDTVVNYGYPLFGELSDAAKISRGEINALAGWGNDSRFIQYDAATQPGNSGGPVLDLSGNVVGIVSAGLSKRYAEETGHIAQNVNFAVKSYVAEGFLDSNGVDFERAESIEKLETADIAEKAERFTVLVGCWQ